MLCDSLGSFSIAFVHDLSVYNVKAVLFSCAKITFFNWHVSFFPFSPFPSFFFFFFSSESFKTILVYSEIYS